MANSPYPYVRDEPYEDFLITNITYGEKCEDDYELYYVDFSIENTGDQYLTIRSIYCGKEQQDYYLIIDTGYSELLPPHTSNTFKGRAQKIDPPGITYKYGTAYAVDNKLATYSGVTYITENDISNGHEAIGKTYEFEINGLKTENDYYYTVIVDYELNGQKHATLTNNVKGFSIDYYGEETPSHEEFKVTGMHLLQGRNRVNAYTRSMWIVIWIVMGILFFMGFIASLIVVPIILFTKKPWNKAIKNN